MENERERSLLMAKKNSDRKMNAEEFNLSGIVTPLRAINILNFILDVCII